MFVGRNSAPKPTKAYRECFQLFPKKESFLALRSASDTLISIRAILPQHSIFDRVLAITFRQSNSRQKRAGPQGVDAGPEVFS
jgi:hypothetical protein